MAYLYTLPPPRGQVNHHQCFMYLWFLYLLLHHHPIYITDRWNWHKTDSRVPCWFEMKLWCCYRSRSNLDLSPGGPIKRLLSQCSDWISPLESVAWCEVAGLVGQWERLSRYMEDNWFWMPCLYIKQISPFKTLLYKSGLMSRIFSSAWCLLDFYLNNTWIDLSSPWIKTFLSGISEVRCSNGIKGRTIFIL